MKRSIWVVLLILLVLCVSCIPVSAMDPGGTAGTVLYHQDFAEVHSPEAGGLKLGTSSSETAEVTCGDGPLSVITKDSGRVYAILPETVKAGSYTLEFSFRFSQIQKENGYLAAILTCRGDEPTNITGLAIRADGTVDDFEAPDLPLKEAIAAGKQIGVVIPIEDGVLHEIRLTADGAEYTLERDSVEVIAGGEMGFAVRNVSAEIPEVWLVDGVGYAEKTGALAADSYASDEADAETAPEPVTESETETEAPETSPNTGNFHQTAVIGGVCILSAYLTAELHRRKRTLG